MYNQQKKNNKNAFTLIEVIIASAVFSLFAAGLFSFYRMGSNMFVKGSWKLQKQKEAERFLTILKERIEQASLATVIDPTKTGDKQISTFSGDFATLKNKTVISTGTPVTTDTRLMIFSICKPDLSKLGQSKGLILYNSLMLVPKNKLFTLYLCSSKSKNSVAGIDFFNSAANYDPSPKTGDFSSSPSIYNLGSDPFVTKLEDVGYIELSNGTSSVIGGASETFKIIGLKVILQNPKHPETKVEQIMHAKLSKNINLDTRATGGL